MGGGGGRGAGRGGFQQVSMACRGTYCTCTSCCCHCIQPVASFRTLPFQARTRCPTCCCCLSLRLSNKKQNAPHPHVLPPTHTLRPAPECLAESQAQACGRASVLSAADKVGSGERSRCSGAACVWMTGAERTRAPPTAGRGPGCGVHAILLPLAAAAARQPWPMPHTLWQAESQLPSSACAHRSWHRQLCLGASSGALQSSQRATNVLAGTQRVVSHDRNFRKSTGHCGSWVHGRRAGRASRQRAPCPPT